MVLTIDEHDHVLSEITQMFGSAHVYVNHLVVIQNTFRLSGRQSSLQQRRQRHKLTTGD